MNKMTSAQRRMLAIMREIESTEKRWRERAQALTAELADLNAKLEKSLKAHRSAQLAAACALDMLPEDQHSGPVGEFLAAIHRHAVQAQLASDEVTNEDADVALGITSYPPITQ